MEVIPGPTEILQPDGAEIDPVQRRNHAVHLVVHRPALRHPHARQGRVPQHASLDMLHDVERSSDHRTVFTQTKRPGHRHTAAVQGLDDAVFTLDRMGRGQQDTVGLLAQHVFAARRGKFIRRVGLAARETARGKRALEARHMTGHVGGQRGFVKLTLHGKYQVGFRQQACARHGVPRAPRRLSCLWHGRRRSRRRRHRPGAAVGQGRRQVGGLAP